MLLVWAIVAFTVSVLAYALQGVTRSAAFASQWVVFGIFVIVLVGVMIGVYTFSTIWSWQSRESLWRRFLCWPSDPAAV